MSRQISLPLRFLHRALRTYGRWRGSAIVLARIRNCVADNGKSGKDLRVKNGKRALRRGLRKDQPLPLDFHLDQSDSIDGEKNVLSRDAKLVGSRWPVARRKP